MFYKDDGGFLATDEDDMPLNELYCMGIIDIMTPYNFKKRVEHIWKGIGHDINQVSAVDPRTYGHRFLDFITRSIKNHTDLLDNLNDYQLSSHSKFKNKMD
jgi:1-phosphatidylinositol-4-phosphate 5-kinase